MIHLLKPSREGEAAFCGVKPPYENTGSTELCVKCVEIDLGLASVEEDPKCKTKKAKA